MLGKNRLENHIFRRAGTKIWEFAFGGSLRRIGGDFKGFGYLARLIDQPNTRISPLELVLDGQPARYRVAAERETCDDLLDPEAMADLRRKMTELQGLLAERDDPTLERELRQIVLFVKHARRPGGKPVSLGTPAIGRTCKSVKNAINRALVALLQDGPPGLSEHLAGCSTPDNYFFVYRQQQQLNWDVSWLIPTEVNDSELGLQNVLRHA